MHDSLFAGSDPRLNNSSEPRFNTEAVQTRVDIKGSQPHVDPRKAGNKLQGHARVRIQRRTVTLTHCGSFIIVSIEIEVHRQEKSVTHSLTRSVGSLMTGSVICLLNEMQKYLFTLRTFTCN